jgi:hypothetical protein
MDATLYVEKLKSYAKEDLSRLEEKTKQSPSKGSLGE